jgi:hypothetical protein
MKMANLLSCFFLKTYSLAITLLMCFAPSTLQILAPRFDLGVTLVNLETDIEMTALILAVVIEVALPCMSWYVH